MKNTIKVSCEHLLKHIWIAYSSIEVEERESNIYSCKILSDESGLLIWDHGKHINAINHLLNLIVGVNQHEKVRIYLEVNDYMKTKDERFKELIFSKVAYVEKTGTELKLPFYSAYDRRKIHGFVSEYGNDSIYTKSIWEWRERRLYICKKDEKLTIDLEGTEI